jgi:hypothetical protein
MTLRKPQSCPSCSSPGLVRIYHGLPTQETWELIRRGDGVAGGCMISPGQPDWECRACRHQWSDPTDPARQQMDDFLRRVTEPVPPPEPPPLIARPDGLLERLWLTQVSCRLPPIDSTLSSKLLERSLRLATKRDRDFFASSHERRLDVSAVRRLPRSFQLAVARSAGPTRWMNECDTLAMLAVEELIGKITKWQDYPRSRWTTWPLPGTSTEAG